MQAAVDEVVERVVALEEAAPAAGAAAEAAGNAGGGSAGYTIAAARDGLSVAVSILDSNLEAVEEALYFSVEILTELNVRPDTMTELSWTVADGATGEGFNPIAVKTSALGTATIGLEKKGGGDLPLFVILRPINFPGTGAFLKFTL